MDEAKGAANDDAAADDGEDDECCALCKSMPHLAVVRCARCWKENEAAELEAAIAKARAEGKSVAGAAFALLGSGGRRRPGSGGGETTYVGARSVDAIANDPCFACVTQWTGADTPRPVACCASARRWPSSGR